MRKILLVLFVVFSIAQRSHGAVGCTLNDPDRDIIRLFPTATNYKTEFITLREHGSEKVAKKVEARLGDNLEPTYESIDVPYAYYTVLSKKKPTGYVHGVNQKGMYGGIQLILATDPNGIIMDFYYQKITSPESKKFRDKKFTKQFIGLSLADFYTRDMTEQIKDPSENNAGDYYATLRGIKKNLILHDEFKLNNRYDKYFYADKEKDKNENGKENKNENKKENP